MGSVSLLTLALDSCAESDRQRSEFQSQLILKGLESNSREEIVRYFDLIRELDLVDDPELEERIASLSEEPSRIPLIGQPRAIGAVPEVTLNGNDPARISECDTYVDAGATATDAEDGDLSNRLSTGSNIENGEPGSYQKVWWVTDSDGNSASVYRDVIVFEADCD